jgi:acetoacetate decarboxylase
MAATRYAEKAVDERRNRELEATGTPSWSESLEAIYETDPELIASVLPRPLEPGPRPLVRVNITTVRMGEGRAFGAGWFGVQARHGDLVGEYPLFMPMTTEQATIGGRETFGEPKKIGEVSARRDGERVHGTIARLGFPLVELRGRITGPRSETERHSCDFYFKLSPSPERPGELDADPLLVHSHKHHTFRVHEGVEGDLVLKDSPLDPIADFTVRRVVDISWTERASVIRAKVIGTVPRVDLLGFVHQRYDDLSVLGTRD